MLQSASEAVKTPAVFSRVVYIECSSEPTPPGSTWR